MSAGIILRKRCEVLDHVGTALLRVKNARRLTHNEMSRTLGRNRRMVANYIAGVAEMGVATWFRAADAWPEIVEKLAEAEKQA